ncbi:hypothetical protein QBC43DRAFT_314851 [Cladorrhinum sp. PSN259]|nr:hypothetical protein QBC43DRAFT_314851 [Cladorrhinum sp. PSN259]
MVMFFLLLHISVFLVGSLFFFFFFWISWSVWDLFFPLAIIFWKVVAVVVIFCLYAQSPLGIY